MSSQPDIAASIKATRNRTVEASPTNTPEPPIRLAPPPKRAADEPTKPLGTRVALSVHEQLGDFHDVLNRRAKANGLKRFTQRELIEMAVRALCERDPTSLL